MPGLEQETRMVVRTGMETALKGMSSTPIGEKSRGCGSAPRGTPFKRRWPAPAYLQQADGVQDSVGIYYKFSNRLCQHEFICKHTLMGMAGSHSPFKPFGAIRTGEHCPPVR
jgi:hypothetical protein